MYFLLKKIIYFLICYGRYTNIRIPDAFSMPVIEAQKYKFLLVNSLTEQQLKWPVIFQPIFHAVAQDCILQQFQSFQFEKLVATLNWSGVHNKSKIPNVYESLHNPGFT